MSETNPPLSSPEAVWPVTVAYARPRRMWLHLLLLVATFLTTLTVGARLEYNFQHNLPILNDLDSGLPLFPLMWVVREPARLLLGLPFALALMAILLAHEMGHYLYCRRYGVQATLPFFIPAPMTLIGTLGAFIRIKSRIGSRDALFDIGIAGPVAGFVLSLPLTFLGLLLSRATSGGPADQDVQFGFPLIFHVVRWLTLGHVAALDSLSLHPIAIAAWVGMFATSLNLLPGGQLDGGHIVFSTSPRAHKLVSTATIVALVPLGIFYWAGWLLWAVLLYVSGLRHPVVPRWPGLTRRRRLLSPVALLLLVLTLAPAPFRNASGRDVGRELKPMLHLPWWR